MQSSKRHILKRSASDVIKKVKERKLKEATANYTFRINVNLMSTFKERCERKGLKMAPVIEELLCGFIQD